jgi:hypothetical protein
MITAKTRTVRFDAATQTLTITVAGRESAYAVEEYDRVEGGRGFALVKLGPKPEQYDVLVADHEHSCTCGDATYRGTQCKHHAALCALILAGKI